MTRFLPTADGGLLNAAHQRRLEVEGAQAPSLVIVEHDPEGMGDDEARIGAATHWRGEGESVEAFRDRLLELAAANGAALVFTGAGPSRRAELAALRVPDAVRCVEIGAGTRPLTWSAPSCLGVDYAPTRDRPS